MFASGRSLKGVRSGGGMAVVVVLYAGTSWLDAEIFSLRGTYK